MTIQQIIEEIEDRINDAWNWDNYDVHFELTNLLEWIRENEQRNKLIEIAENNTKRNEDGLTVIEKDDPWRE